MGYLGRAFITCALTTLLAAQAIGIAAEKSSSAVSSPARTRISIDNFGQVSSSFYRGAQPDGSDYSDLAALGIKLVIDLQKDGIALEQKLVEAAGMKFHRIGMTTHEPPTTEQLASFLKLVNDPANQPVYVHCAGGRHRTGVMTAVYRMTHDRWNAEQAFKEMKQYKFGADFLHPEFKRFVHAYHVQPVQPAPAVLATSVIASEPASAP
jgi:tyrosine-protein phosphatase SIW14